MTLPLLQTCISDIETPVSLFHKISQDEPFAFLLDSADGDNRLARYSFIGVSPVKTVRFSKGKAIIYDALKDTLSSKELGNPLDILQEEQLPLIEQYAQNPSGLSFPFMGGWVGYMGYGATRYFENIPQQQADPLQVPEGYYGLYDTVLLFDHLYRRITFLSYREHSEAKAILKRIQSRISETEPLLPLFFNHDISEADIFNQVSSSFTPEKFMQTVGQAKGHIEEGQAFQIVLSQRFSLPVTCDPLDIYRTLQAVNPSPYSYYLKFPEFTYLGSSPETYVQCQDGKVVLRALAGTRPRGVSEAQDQLLAQELKADAKELAEHRMLVDLARNDLGKICEVSSITVGELAKLTRYSHVMHLATEVSGQLRDDKTMFDVFRSCFPRGTVSGAPKIRAMQLLSQLEPEQRGIYSGVVGYFNHNGNMDGAIAIRSVLIKDGMAHVNAGAGIVFDSKPEAEYQETRNKAKSMLKAIQLAERNSKPYAYRYSG